MARNPYELRMECLSLAESRLRDRYQEAKERFQYLDERGLIADEEAWETVTFEDATAAPISYLMSPILSM